MIRRPSFQDRNGSFEPAIVPNHEQRLPIFTEQIVSLYVNGMTVRNIYRVTDSILTEVRVGGTGRWMRSPP